MTYTLTLGLSVLGFALGGAAGWAAGQAMAYEVVRRMKDR